MQNWNNNILFVIVLLPGNLIVKLRTRRTHPGVVIIVFILGKHIFGFSIFSYTMHTYKIMMFSDNKLSFWLPSDSICESKRMSKHIKNSQAVFLLSIHCSSLSWALSTLLIIPEAYFLVNRFCILQTFRQTFFPFVAWI